MTAGSRRLDGRLEGRLIALGITGSIAAYKAPELVRALQAEGADVVALVSPAATRFVAPLALEALTRHPVEDDIMALLPDGRIGHVVIADSADAILVAPATAHWLGAMANGLAGDTVTATCLASGAPVVVAPAMDGEMYVHPATQTNVRRLREEFGYTVVDPEAGPLASGAVGVGRLADFGMLVEAVVEAVHGSPIREPDPDARPQRVRRVRDADLENRHLLVTAGGTAEPIDPVRFIGNRSTGKMGAAIAEAALDRGARVTLIVGHTSVPLPGRAQVVDAETTAAMRDAVLEALPVADALVMAAAVADFRPRRAADQKLTRDAGLTLELEPTEDVLAEAATTARRFERRPILVGFAAETGSLERAPAKLARKGVDLLVANDVSEPGSGFGSDTNRVTILGADGRREDLPLLSKREVADRLLDRVARALDDRDAAAQTSEMSETTAR
ncbi:MAG TPA: bifunctional phosphopantothenoylcysteine decarboxylase/phosphopantothenate--cysteine ligase CoaBC [Vitreimonas sp.]|nr:bifunctional phosphopantothenoylcysteine decarboxylase/phosphopantothenate--cysteine ligase CoaBC [Vitreimonas sp.]